MLFTMCPVAHAFKLCSRRVNTLAPFRKPSCCASVSTCWVQEIEQKHVVPELYPYGSRGPVGAHYLAAKYGVRWGDLAADADEE